MTVPLWPEDLPQYMLRSSFAGEGPDNVIESQMAIGPAKTRRRTVANVRKVSGAFVMTASQMESFEAFYGGDIADGAKAFYLPNQRGGEVPYLVRIVGPYKYGPVGEDSYRVEIALEILP